MTSEKKDLRCCFTGHRPQKLLRKEKEIKRDLEEAIQKAVRDGYTTFITGMAYGVDIWAGEIICQLRQTHPEIHLIAAVPFPGFEERWTPKWKKAYVSLLDKADLVRFICPDYSPQAYQKRNEWMVDHASRVIAVFNGEQSGTKNTIDYAEKTGVEVVTIPA